jgi:hypothetical protein
MNSNARSRWVWVDAFEYTTTTGITATEPELTGMVQSASTLDVADQGSLHVGYASVERTDTVAGPVGGIAKLSLRQSSDLVAETGIPPSGLIDAGRIAVEESERISTGIAFANPNDQINTVTFQFSDAAGQTVGGGTLDLPPRGQLARFSDDAPFGGRSSFFGTLTFTSTLPVAATAIRTLVNERWDFIFTGTVIADLTVESQDPVTIPHFAEGAGWSTETLLVNPSDQPISGTVEFAGTGKPNSTYSIGPGGATKVVSGAFTGAFRTGGLRIIPTASTPSPAAVSILSYKANGTTTSEVGIPAVEAGSSFTLFAEKLSDLFKGTPGSAETGLAVFNSGGNTTLQFELIGKDQTRYTATSSLPVNSHVALYLRQLSGFANVPENFEGVLHVRSTGSDVSMVGIRSTWNQRGDLLFSLVPAVNYTLTHPNASFVFPHFAFGSGFSTRFIVFDNAAGQAGRLYLYDAAGNLLQP